MKQKLTLDQEQALIHFKEGRQNLFVTGGAGTGKSFLIQTFLKETSEEIPVLASTGAAAILVGGRTFHSYFSLGLMQEGAARATFERAIGNKRLKTRLRKASTIIIDEISMLSHETLDCAEAIARELRGRPEPWGGIRVVAVGDFAQLPPVSRMRTQRPWAFLGEAWATSAFKRINLKEVMRSSDPEFLKILDDVRRGDVSIRVRHFLDQQTREYVDSDVTHMFPRRDQTDGFNRERLAELTSESRKYETIYSGDALYFEQLKREAPVPPVLELKKGALVMIRMNDIKQRYVNGTVGHVVAMHDDRITVQTAERKFDIEPYAFSVHDADGQEVAFAKNFPLNLAYASTIHKIQGATLSRLHVDLGALWEPGQAYVALSRARKGKDLTLMRWSERSIISDSLVESFYRNSNEPLGSNEELQIEGGI